MIPLVMSVIAKTETFQRDMAKTRMTVGKFSKSVSKSSISMQGLSRSILRLAGIGGGLFLLQRGIRGAISAGLEQEKVERQLAAALDSTGDSTRGNLVDLKKYAAELQRLTIFGDELIISQMAYASNLGITTDKLKEASVAAIGLAAKYRLDLKAAMMLVGRASQGQTSMLTRYGIVLDESLSTQEKFNALLKIGADSFHLAEAEARTASGAWAQFANNAGDIGEQISMGVLPALTSMLTEINDNKDAWQEFFRVQTEGWAEVFSGLKSVKTVLAETSRRMEDRGLVPRNQRFGMWAPMPQIEAAREAARNPQGLPIGTLDISPSGFRRISEMNNRVLEMERAAARQAETASAAGAEEVEVIAETTEAARKAAADREQITVRMYADLGRFGDGYLRAQMALLDQQKADYAEHITDKVLLEQWYANEVKNILENMRIADLDAMGLYHEELRKDMAETARFSSEKFAEAFRSIERSVSDAFFSMRLKGAEWRDSMAGFWNSVGDIAARTAADMAARMVMLQAMNIGMAGVGMGGGIIGGIGSLFMHGGGVVGSDGVGRMVPAGTFAGAPRMHGGGVAGLRSDEVPIIAQIGERILKKGDHGNGGGGQTIYVENYFEEGAVQANDVAGFDAMLYRSKETIGDLQIMNQRNNHRGRNT